jgi:DNA (cytosine-5)-methyltransferase 1
MANDNPARANAITCSPRSNTGIDGSTVYPPHFGTVPDFVPTLKAIDLFCGAGGATKGLQRAGFHVTGVDNKPQPRYCGDEFIQADALTVPLDGYDFIWASPPCQRYSAGAAKWGTAQQHPDLIWVIRERIGADREYVIENIAPAWPYLIRPVQLCGQVFGLGVFRHRIFEASFRLIVPDEPIHNGHVGDGQYHTVTGHSGGRSRRDGWIGGSVADWRKAMDIDWMTGAELSQAIPPAYSEFIGKQAIAFLKQREATHV